MWVFWVAVQTLCASAERAGGTCKAHTTERTPRPSHGQDAHATLLVERSGLTGLTLRTRAICETVTNAPLEGNSIDRGTWLTGAGASALFASLFLTWYTYGISVGNVLRLSISRSGWDSGGFLIKTLALIALLAAALTVLDVTGRAAALALPSGRVLRALGVAALVVVLLKCVVTPAEIPAGQGVDVGYGYGLFVALIAAATLAFGGYLRLSSE